MELHPIELGFFLRLNGHESMQWRFHPYNSQGKELTTRALEGKVDWDSLLLWI